MIPGLGLQYPNNMAAMGRIYFLRIQKDGNLGVEQYLKNQGVDIFCGKHFVKLFVSWTKHNFSVFFHIMNDSMVMQNAAIKL